jgi:5-methyltetrahydropteroyltriglutamate--homocysteine methyltransferase
MRFRAKPPGVVESALGSGTLDLPGACARALKLTTRPLKFTLTGPHMLAKTLIDHHYGSIELLTQGIAEVLAAQVSHCHAQVIQVDEANLPGHPEEWRWALRAMNTVLDAIPGKSAVHLCFGNYGGQSVQKGAWDALMEYLNGLHADHIVMEVAHRPASELAVFKELQPHIGFGMGVVDIKRTDVETAEQIAQAIEQAEKLLGTGRVSYIHPDCGFWMLKRSIADAKIRALVAGRDLFERAGA